MILELNMNLAAIALEDAVYALIVEDAVDAMCHSQYFY